MKKSDVLPKEKLVFIAAKVNQNEIDQDINFLLQKSQSKEQNSNTDIEGKIKIITTISPDLKKANEDTLFVAEIRSLQQNQFDHAVIITHGMVENRGNSQEKHVALTLDIAEQIKYLRQEKGIKDFHIVSCNGGALIHDLNREKFELKDTNITIYSSSKYSIPEEIMDLIGKIFGEILHSEDSKNYQQSTKIVAANRFKYSAETIIFSAISENGELSAIKIHNPKSISQDKSKARNDQLAAFDSADNLANYFAELSLAPLYLNEINDQQKRIVLPENFVAKIAIKTEGAKLNELTSEELEEFYKCQLKYSLVRFASIKDLEAVSKIIDVTSQMSERVEILNYRDGVGNSALIWGSIADSISIVEKLLNTNKVDINQTTNYGGTALMLSIFNRHITIVEKLIKSGATINEPISKYDGRTSLAYALMLDNDDKNDEEKLTKAEQKKHIVKSLLLGLNKEKEQFELETKSQFGLNGSGAKDGEKIEESLKNYVNELERNGDTSQEAKSINELSAKLLTNNLRQEIKENSWVEKVKEREKESKLDKTNFL